MKQKVSEIVQSILGKNIESSQETALFVNLIKMSNLQALLTRNNFI